MTVQLTAQAQPYLKLAQKLVDGRISEDQLPSRTAPLLLNRELLDHLADQAETIGLKQPKLGWAITAVADAAAVHLPDTPFLQALSAWYLARAANIWTRPHQVEKAAARARSGFIALGQTDWTAACDWQLNAQPWTRPNMEQVQTQLETALTGLESTSSQLAFFGPQCRLALAYSQVLAGNFSAAALNIEQCEASFIAENNQRQLAYCLFVKSGLLRRQSRLEQAMTCIEKALTLFRQQSESVGIAWSTFQLGFNHWLLKTDYPRAEANFIQAHDQFQALDMPLPAGLCQGGLA